MARQRMTEDQMVPSSQYAFQSAHDWEEEKRRDRRRHKIYDDGTMTFFWRAHNLTTLVVFACILVYVTFFDHESTERSVNTKRGLVAVVLAFVLFGVTHTPDGPFRRPHPALWRLVMCFSIVYELALVFLLFQTVSDARALMRHFDDSLGIPLPEKEYGGNCVIYDPQVPHDPFHNLWDKMDGFVPTHFFGWWLKVLEYTLEHQLPNFSECWWDHWLMDALLCNGLGIYLGMKTLNYLSMKQYNWRGMWNIPSYTGKISRVLKQFTPYSWTDFDWRPTLTLKRWFAMLCLIAIFLVAELNTFYLKFVLWIPPPHPLCLSRLVFFLFIGAVSMRETFQYLDDPNCKKFGTQSWLCISIIITELCITLKFDWETITKPVPMHMAIVWGLGLLGLLLWTVWYFYLQRLLWHTEQKLTNGMLNNNNNTKRQSPKKQQLYSNGTSNGLAENHDHNSVSAVRSRGHKRE